MDFGNYTIGRLIPNRANYDDETPRLRPGPREDRATHVRLGIPSRSGSKMPMPRSAMRHGMHADHAKVDRYGKKYSWIAYYEMWGEREAERKLPERRVGERTSDCGVDPSFPTRPSALDATNSGPVWRPRRFHRNLGRGWFHTKTGVRCSWSRRSVDTKVSGYSWKGLFVEPTRVTIASY